MRIYLITNRAALKTRSNRLQTRVSLVSDACLTANRTDYLWSSRQETSPLDHTSQITIRLKAAINSSRICSSRRTS